MKRLFGLLLSLVAVTSWAQTDVTYLLDDPDFEQAGRSAWKTNSFGRQGNDSFTLKHGDYYREIWSGGTAGDAYLYLDLIDLPAGTYTFTMTCQNIKESNASQVCTGAWIYANDQTKEFNKPGDYSVTCVVRDGNLRVGAETKNCTGNYVCVDNCRLTYQVIYEDIKDYLAEIIDEVDQIDKKNSSAERTEMLAARDALKILYDAQNNDGLTDALARLRSAIWAYRLSVASASDPLDMTDVITNPGFESDRTGWTMNGMGTQTNSSFPGKKGNVYAETWTGSGGVGDASIQQVLTDMPNGRYKLTASAWNVQESNTSVKQSGVYLCLDHNSTSVNVLGTYSVECVSVGGDLTIGFKSQKATGNYVCVDDFHLYYLGFDSVAENNQFQQLIASAEVLLDKQMNASEKSALEKAIADAKALTGTKGRADAANALNVAITNAQDNIAVYETLDKVIQKGQDIMATAGSVGTEKLQGAITSAQNMKNSGNIDADMVAAASSYMDEAIFAYRILNGSGTAPTVTTDPTVIVGCNGMVGRMKASGSNIMERGFCWAENPNPSVLDHHTSYNHSNDETNYQPVYIMYDVEASTEYWVRAYAITKTYAVGYGEPVRVITLPQGTTEYTYLWNGDDDHNEWLDNAMREATAYYNTWTAIKGFHPTANYSPGTETADCSYGGWINVGPWRCNTGTMVHEMMHGTGVGQHGRWWSKELHNLDVSVAWLGERGNRVTQFFEIDPSRGNYVCNGDGMHVCYEGNGNDTQQIRSAILCQALYEDGLPAVSDGACPFYSFESIDSLKYYITNCEYGADTKYLNESEAGKLVYTEASVAEILNDDAYAWHVIYDKMTGLYTIRNAKTGKNFVHNGGSVSLSSTQPASNQQIQLMPARIMHESDLGYTTISSKPYWFARGNRVETPPVMAVTSASSNTVSTPQLNFGNDATTQFWMIRSTDEIRQIAEARQAFGNDRLERYIAGSKAVVASAHREIVDGTDAEFTGVIESIEQAKDTYTFNQVEEAITALLTGLAAYLPAIEVADSVNLTFLLDDAALETGAGWTDLPELTKGMLNITNTPVFKAKQVLPMKMPAGSYGIFVRGYQRPGTAVQSMKDYAAGTNNVKTQVAFNATSRKIMHIGDGARTEKLGMGGTETLYSGLYVPITSSAVKAYLEAGRYDQVHRFTNTVSRTVTITLKNIATVTSDNLVVDNLGLFYYGSDSQQTGIDCGMTDGSEEVEGYYTLSGLRIAKPARGIVVIKYRDGRVAKVKM